MVKINMMCGKRNFGEDWVHIDAAEHNNNVALRHVKNHDIWLKDQFNNSIDLIYCSHGIAYISPQEIANLLRSWFKKIRPGGCLRIATPDWEQLRKLDQPLLGPLYGAMNNGIIYGSEYIYHKTIYTFESLHKLLSEAGFINIHRYDHTKTEHPNTGDRNDKHDDCSAAYHNGQLISLNVQCYKP